MNTDEAYDYFSARGVPNARQAFADYYRKLVEEGLRSAREEPLVEHAEVMRLLKETIERHSSKQT